LAVRPAEGPVVRASLGSGFRAPSLYELFHPFYGNTGLQPETSVSAELGVEKTYDSGATVRITGFYTEIDDLIQYDFTTSKYAQVAGTSKTKGIEIAAEAPLSDTLSIFGSFTYTDARSNAGTRLMRVPTHDTVIGLDAQFGSRISAQATLQHVNGLTDLAGAMPSYTVANAVVTYDISDTTQAYLRVENLFDEEYQVINGYGTSDRAAFFGIRGEF
jgi:vitamin B12 transporter